MIFLRLRPLLLLLLLLPLVLFAQPDSLFQVPGMPSREVYSLLRDHNGFLWLGHSAGISRYDGQRLVNYGTPRQSGRAMSGLCEDPQGRIWCYNFEGQILYIEQNKLHVLEQFRFNEESTFPRIALFGDELVSSCSKGFFTCNTRTFECRYYQLPYATASLAVLDSGVLLRMPGIERSFWWYQKGQSPRQLRTSIEFARVQDVSLQGSLSPDTAYLALNPQGTFYKLWVRGDSLFSSQEIREDGFINTITKDGEELWVHTLKSSRSNHGRSVVGQQLTNVQSDLQGNTFYSSLRRGLLMSSSPRAIREDKSFLEPGDYIRALASGPGVELFGTQQGVLYVARKAQPVKRFTLPASFRGIQRIYPVNDSIFLVAASNGLLRMTVPHLKLDLLDSFLMLRDLSIRGNNAVLATIYGLYQLSVSDLTTRKEMRTLTPKNSDWRRCRTVCAAPDGSVFASFNSGLYRWAGSDSGNITFEGERLYSPRIRNFAGKTLIATFNKGLLQYNNGKLQTVLSMPEGMANSIPDLKVSGGTAWVLYDDQVQEVDSQFRVREVMGLPCSGAEVLDLIERPGGLLLATEKGLFFLPRSAAEKRVSSRTLIDNIRINDSLNVTEKQHEFKYRENNLQISLSTPWFNRDDHLRYRYRLCTGEDRACNWLMSAEGQNAFSFVNLPPGTYTFSAIAVNSISTPLSSEITYTFTIRPPWWATWWARLLSVLVLMTLFFLMGLYLHRRRSRQHRQRYEKMLAVEHERQRISAEIHDDLGATLFGVRILTELAREKMPPGQLRADVEKIHQSITSLTEKTREVIWTLSTEQDTLESLILYLQKQAQLLFESATVQLQVHAPLELPPATISGDIRRQIYLAVKEALHNCLKHSGSTWCRLNMTCTGGQLHISVTDNGQGISKEQSRTAFSSGMRTMQQRMDYAGGQLLIGSSANGTEMQFIIPLTLNDR
ncbi:MAG: hypothetical protein EOO15_18220 [Chitinophagaceae bacterium]|nr:MAG: hypothetical protein EOO15_18220 [Chitinophagaceae bacterium]